MSKMQKIIVLTNTERGYQRKFYTVDTSLIDRPFAIFRQPALPEDKPMFDQVGQPGGQIAFDLMQQDGIEAVKLEKESIKVTASASWKQIQPFVRGVLEEHLGKLEVATTDYGLLTETAATEAEVYA